MLDDIRNSTLLTMVSAVLMAVATIVLQPEPQRHEARPAARAATQPPAATAVAARAPDTGTCEGPTAVPRSQPDAPVALTAR